MLSSKQRKYLEKAAHTLKPVVYIGKNGLTPEVSKSARENINRNELLKVKILKEAPVDKMEISQILAERIGGETVSIIGNIIIIFKQKREKSRFTLPK